MYKKGISVLLAAALLFTGCAGAGTDNSQGIDKSEEREENDAEKTAGGGKLRFEVDPETFSLSVFSGETELQASLPGEGKKVEGFEKGEDEAAWFYPEQKLNAAIRAEKNYLEVELSSAAEADNTGNWPLVKGDFFYLPLGEGKRIPGDDERWKEYLTDTELTVTESLSMPFFAVSHGDKALLYIMEEPLRTQMQFKDSDGLTLELKHQYPMIAEERTKKFRIYVTDNDPVQIAGFYRDYVKEQGKFVTLEEKAQTNTNVRKLYGAPHIYLWCGRAISPEDINWNAFRAAASGPQLRYLAEYVKSLETGSSFSDVLKEIENQDYVSQYQKNVVCQGITEAVRGADFYNQEIFQELPEEAAQILQKEKPNGLERFTLNKAALHENLKGIFSEPEEWGLNESTALIEEMQDSGIESAWIGLDNWENAWFHKSLVESAVNAGYLSGPYDSYHSIHKPGEEQWNTAAFEDAALYDEAAVEDENGKKISGFNGVGRKLNPTLAMPSVKQRVEQILSTGIPFNSWFVDCDAAGEIYDDYTPSRRTTMEQDTAARNERLDYIGREKNMVVGSEGGNDYAAPFIAFAHGIELPSFSWRDKDMKENKESEYYIGRYYSASGGIPEHFGKKIPLKEKWSHIFTDISFDVPLYRLVYNNSVITTYHWDWSTLKITGEEKNRMMREILYNVPPLYHLDRESWDENKEIITAHVKVWSDFARDAVQEEMTDFQYLTEDGKVQKTAFGKSMEVVANFSDMAFQYKTTEISPGSVLMISGGSQRLYTPLTD